MHQMKTPVLFTEKALVQVSARIVCISSRSAENENKKGFQAEGKCVHRFELFSHVSFFSMRIPNLPIPTHASIPLFHARFLYFLLNEQPSVKRALPPVGWQRTWEQPAQTTTVCAWEKTVVMVKQPGHLTSMKKERGPGTKVWWVLLV
jgi:hypothetical protein